MVRIIKFRGENTYQCDDCGLKYKEKNIAEKCEAWCKKHHSCNIEITKNAINKYEMLK